MALAKLEVGTWLADLKSHEQLRKYGVHQRQASPISHVHTIICTSVHTAMTNVSAFPSRVFATLNQCQGMITRIVTKAKQAVL